MAVIKSWSGTRFTKEAGDLNTLTCPPYDIISPEQKKELLEKNPHNIVQLELPGTAPEDYENAKNILENWKQEGILAKDTQPQLYVYELEFKHLSETKTLKGLVCLVKLEEFEKGIVLPHEETLSKAKTDRFNLMEATHSNFSQIYSLYMDNGDIHQILDENSLDIPDMEVTDRDGTIHRMWLLSDTKIIAEISDKFSEKKDDSGEKKLYIADGHHRYETALNFKKAHPELAEAEYLMMFLVDMENEGLVVLPTHRIVRGLENFDLNNLLEKASENFEIKKVENDVNANYPEKTFILITNEDKYQLTFKGTLEVEGKSAAYCDLDVTILHELILEKILGIDKENMAKQINLTYTKYEEEAVKSVESGNADCAFILQPTKIYQIKDVANAGEKMPQKSTYFYPKMLTGLVINCFD